MNPHPLPTTRSDVLEILQREQDHAVSLLSLSPFLSSLFISFAGRATALEPVPATPPESEELKALQAAVTTLRVRNEKRGSGVRGTVGRSELAEASQEAFHFQIASLKETNRTQQDDINSMRAELSEAKEKYDQLMVDSNAEKAVLQAQVLDLEVRWDIVDRTRLLTHAVRADTTGGAEGERR